MTSFPKHLRRMVDFCCDNGNVTGCGHHIDGHGYGNNCEVPGCECRNWHDHTLCGHREQDATEAKAVADLARFRESVADLAVDCEAFPEEHPAATWMTATARRVRLILAGERP